MQAALESERFSGAAPQGPFLRTQHGLHLWVVTHHDMPWESQLQGSLSRSFQWDFVCLTGYIAKPGYKIGKTGCKALFHIFTNNPRTVAPGVSRMNFKQHIMNHWLSHLILILAKGQYQNSLHHQGQA